MYFTIVIQLQQLNATVRLVVLYTMTQGQGPKAKDLTLMAKAKAKDSKVVLEESHEDKF